MAAPMNPEARPTAADCHRVCDLRGAVDTVLRDTTPDCACDACNNLRAAGLSDAIVAVGDAAKYECRSTRLSDRSLSLPMPHRLTGGILSSCRIIPGYRGWTRRNDKSRDGALYRQLRNTHEPTATSLQCYTSLQI